MHSAFIKIPCFFLLYAVLHSALNAQPSSYSMNTDFKTGYQTLRNGFAKPPGESKLRCYWWWLNGMATPESITRDLEEMKAKGYGGAAIVDAGSSNYEVALKTKAGPVFLSKEWIDMYQYAVREADRLGIELSVNLGSGWNPGGPDISPEHALKKIVWSETNVTGGKKVRIFLEQPETNLLYKDILVQAVPGRPNLPLGEDAIKNWNIKTLNRPIGWKGMYPLYKLREDYSDAGKDFAIRRNEIIDLTKCLKGDTLEWMAPPGEWTILRYGYTCTGVRTSTTSDGWSGLSLDHLSAEAFQVFSRHVILPLIHSAQSAGNSVHFLQTDSWEMGVANWTDDFPSEFRKDHGYTIENYMPVLTGRIVESRHVSNRFLHDFRQTVGNCIKRNHYQLLSSIAHQHGMGICPESGGPHSAPVDALEVMSVSDFPQGEFWAKSNTHRIKDDERFSVKQSACVAHTWGKRFVAAEGPTSIGPHWERGPKDLKNDIDRVFCSGVNRIVWHTFTSSPAEFGLPGNEYFAGTHLNPNVTWWEMAGSFIDYLNRCSYMLQQGLFVADVLYFYGDDVPNFVFLKEEVKDLPSGYDWDKCSKSVILNRISISDGKIVLPDGMTYRMMVLPDEKSIDIEVLKKIRNLVNDGMTLIGPPPQEPSGLSGYPKSDKELKKIVNKLWGKIDGIIVTENRFGKGRVIWGKSLAKVMAEMKVSPDFRFASSSGETSLDFIHRSTQNQEIYFVVNRFEYKGVNDFSYRYNPELPDRFEQAECYFRVTGKVPEIWDPVSGEINEVLIYREEGDYTIIPLYFNPGESKFVVFRNGRKAKHITEIKKDDMSIFPGSTFAPTEFPYLTIERHDSLCEATVFEPGEYRLIWSDGSENRISVNKPPLVLTVSGPWQVYFDPGRRGPGFFLIDTLKSWTSFSDEGIRYYSGKATYSCQFKFPDVLQKSHEFILDLGNVQEMASVTFNGSQSSVCWAPPFRIDITDRLKAGINDLSIDVINLWPNRLIGDGRLPEEKRYTKTNIQKFYQPGSERFLRVSGLLGPVRIIAAQKFWLP
jgi:hypothetical protein